MKDYQEAKEWRDSKNSISTNGSLLMSTLGYQRLKSASMGDLDSPQSALSRFSSSVISSVSASGSFLASTQVRADTGDYSDKSPRGINSTPPLLSTSSKKSLGPISPSASVFHSVAERQVMRRLLLHFIYKDRPTSQFTSPTKMEPPYATLTDQKRLFRLYQHVHRLMNGDFWASNNSDGSVTVNKVKKEMKRMRKSHKILFFVGTRESILGWVTPSFELYATFGPMVSKAACIYACNQLLTWIKAEEVSLFIMNSPVW